MIPQIIEVRTCEVCGNGQLIQVLDLGDHPLCDDLVSIGNNRPCREYPIQIFFCETCRTAHQRYQVPKRELFPTSYHYRSRFTADVLNGMTGLVASCENRFGSLGGKTVLDVGCNDGSLLDFFERRGAITLGIEPTAACNDAKAKGHITFNDFISEDVANAIIDMFGKPDFITFTNVFAHIENLKEVLGSLKRLMGDATIIVIENHYLGAVLAGSQFDTFYHEHPRTYSFTSFVNISQSLGVKCLGVEFPQRYGGNIRVYLGKSTKATNCTFDMTELCRRENRFIEEFEILKNKISHWRQVKMRAIQEQVRIYGRLRAKAFPGRAAILIKLLGLNEDIISEVFEKPGSLKIGHYIPGTRIPIISDDDLWALADKTKPILNLAWHIPNEIRAYLAKYNYTGPIIDILNIEDFQLTR